MRPLEDRVFIEPDKPKEKTKSGIYIPEGAMAQETQFGTVTHVGETVNSKIKVGDRVMYLKQSGIGVDIDGEFTSIVRYVDILSIL